MDVWTYTGIVCCKFGMLPRVCGYGNSIPEYYVDQVVISAQFLSVDVDFKCNVCYYFNDADFPHKYI